MKKDEIDKVLQILDFALKHPISNSFRNLARNGEEYSLEKVRERIANNYYSTPKEALDKIYETIDSNAEIDSNEDVVNFLKRLGKQVKKLLKKKTKLLFSSPRDWGLKVTKLRSKLAYLTAHPPASVKALCQWPTRPYIVKPQIEFDGADNLKYIAECLNDLQKSEENESILNQVKQIIEEKEPGLFERKGEIEINVAELNHSTILELKKFLFSTNQI